MVLPLIFVKDLANSMYLFERFESNVEFDKCMPMFIIVPF